MKSLACMDLWVSWCCQCHGGDLSVEVSIAPRAFRDVNLQWESISVACNGGWVFLWVFGFLQFSRLCVDLVNLVFRLLHEKEG